jgi:uncharacterized membrane protein YedE/YeeE
MEILTSVAAVFLACIIGFSTQRAGFCSVRAVEEVLTTKRAYMLASFVKITLWVISITWLIELVSSGEIVPKQGWSFSYTAIIGGAIFGIGATFNGGCAFSTLTRLGSGNIGMIFSLAGFVIGLLIFEFIAPKPNPQITPAFSYYVVQQSGGVVAVASLLGCWVAWQLYRLVQAIGIQNWRAKILAPHYRLSTSALLMGGSGAVLLVLVGVWPFTSLFRQLIDSLVSGTPAPSSILWVLFGALLVGIGISAWQSQKFHWRWEANTQRVKYGVGGVLMGCGAAMVPGGNDILLLQAIPTLSQHAVPAFVSMLVSIAATLYCFQLFGQKIPLVNCESDICSIDFDSANGD